MSLVGTWVVDETDARALADLGNVQMDFGEGGGLVYTIRGKESDQIMKLRYKVKGSVIVTDQPSAPRVERTQFSVSDDILTLAFGGVPYRFVRVACSPELGRG
jgi:hypothetical protein